MKKLLKFLMLLACVFASSLQLDAANGEQEKDPSEECSICLDKLYYTTDDADNLVLRPDIQITTLRCGHKFHKTCIDRWFAGQRLQNQTQTCPICRTEITIPQPPVQPIPQETQNARIIPVPSDRNKITCVIFTQAGFIEVKNYLQIYRQFVNLRLILTDNIRQIPGDFFVGLEQLKFLNLNDNRLTSLPTQIVNLRSLEKLWLENNQLTSLPARIGQLNQLQKLNLIGNQLTTLPNSIGSLRSLRDLWLDNNQLTTLPAGIGNLRRLERLDLGKNQLTTLPASIGNLINLLEINLYHNQLTTLPAGIGNLRRLEKLHLAQNKLPNFPPSIGQLISLKELYLNENQLTTLPELIGQLTSLKLLSLEYNQLTSLPESIGRLENLEWLSLNNNQLTFLPESIGNLRNLEILNFSSNHIIPLPTGLINQLRRRGVDVLGQDQLIIAPSLIQGRPLLPIRHETQHAGFRQSFEPRRQESPNVRIIPILRNQIDCSVLTQFGFAEVKNYLENHPSVVILRLILTDNTRQIPEDFFVGLTQLQGLDLSRNRLPSLPWSIGYITNLGGLNLQQNQLTSLPTEIGQLTNLKWLWLEYNQLTYLPFSIGSLINLQALGLQYNQLTYLPNSIENLINLKFLYLHDNHIIPWPTGLIERLRRQSSGIYIVSQDSQTPARQSVSFFKRIETKIKFAFSKIFKRKA